MRHVIHLRNLLARGLGLWAVILTLGGLRDSQAQPLDRDPVQGLRQALKIIVVNPNDPNELKFRTSAIERRLAGIRTISDMRRALNLQEWRDTDVLGGKNVGIDQKLREEDQRFRAELADRLERALREVLQRGNEASKLAAIVMIGEMGVLIRDVHPRETSYARRFASALIALVRGPNRVLSAAAARSLGRITPAVERLDSVLKEMVPDPTPAAEALGSLFATGNLDQRLAAADALNNMMRISAELVPGLRPTGVEGDRREMAQVGKAVATMAARGVKDSDAQVRRLCLEALFTAAETLGDVVPDPDKEQDLPPLGRKLSKEEMQVVEDRRRMVREERAELLPMAEALANQAPLIASALSDPDPNVRVEAARALELMGNARQRLERRAAVWLQPFGEVSVADAPINKILRADPLGTALEKVLPELATAVSDPDVRVRLAAIDALEMVPEQLEPVVPALAKALGDCDRFVRWAAARTLGKAADVSWGQDITPIGADLVMPGLIRLLGDPDLGVRVLGADFALQRYGPYAAPAVPALKILVGKGDAESRIAAINTLVNIGVAAAPAVPAITEALSNTDVRVRRSAAEALGKFGPAARSAIPALQKALYDQDDDVRRAASESLLSIDLLPTGK